MTLLNKLSPQDLESTLKSFKVSYADLRLLNEVNNEQIFLVDLQSRFALYHALHNKYFEIKHELTSKFLISYLKLSFQTSQKILNNLAELGFIEKIKSQSDKRMFIYQITRMGEKAVLLWESFKVNDYAATKKVTIHDDGLLNMNEKRLAEYRKEFLEN
jgi:DNA-binding MarR family transcriptional regulator